jgi:hypothetical protein
MPVYGCGLTAIQMDCTFAVEDQLKVAKADEKMGFCRP